MKRFLILILSFTSLTALALAQPLSGGGGTGSYEDSLSSFGAFEAYFFRFFRVVDAPCPSDIFGDTCYLHGYDDFFDFRDRFDTLFVGSMTFPEGLTEVERWALETTEIDGDDIEVFQATYQLPGGEPFTLTFSSPRYIFLER